MSSDEKGSTVLNHTTSVCAMSASSAVSETIAKAIDTQDTKKAADIDTKEKTIRKWNKWTRDTHGSHELLKMVPWDELLKRTEYFKIARQQVAKHCAVARIKCPMYELVFRRCEICDTNEWVGLIKSVSFARPEYFPEFCTEPDLCTACQPLCGCASLALVDPYKQTMCALCDKLRCNHHEFKPALSNVARKYVLASIPKPFVICSVCKYHVSMVPKLLHLLTPNEK